MERPDRRVVLLRHGNTEWADTGRHTSTTEVDLTERGQRQAEAAGTALAALGLISPLVICSPRLRAQRTAALAGLHVDDTWDLLAEWDYGTYEGLTTAQIRQTVAHWTVFTHPSPGGEPLDAVGHRADTVIAAVEPSLDSRDVILVGHGHFSRVLVARWCGFPAAEGARFALGPASYTVLGYEHSRRQVVTSNAGARAPE